MEQVTAPKPFVFVLMPFSGAFDDVYQLGIKDACKECGAHCERVDEQIFEGTILERIYNQISKADIVVADMTGKNANVFYETGYAHALGKRVILLTQHADDIPFDMKHYPHIVYGGKITELRTQLARRLRVILENPDTDYRRLQPRLEFYHQGELVDGRTILIKQNISVLRLSLGIHNPGQQPVGPIRLAIMTSSRLAEQALEGGFSQSAIILPDGRLLHEFPMLGHLLPDAWCSFEVSLRRKLVGQRETRDGSFPVYSTETEEIIIQFYTEIGPQSVSFTINFAPSPTDT